MRNKKRISTSTCMCSQRDSSHIDTMQLMSIAPSSYARINALNATKRRKRKIHQMTSIYLVQIASVPGHQAGQRQFEENRFLHNLLINLLVENQSEKKQIALLSPLVPQHEIVLRSGFSHTAQWGLEPNMFLQVRTIRSAGSLPARLCRIDPRE